MFHQSDDQNDIHEAEIIDTEPTGKPDVFSEEKHPAERIVGEKQITALVLELIRFRIIDRMASLLTIYVICTTIVFGIGLSRPEINKGIFQEWNKTIPVIIIGLLRRQNK
ncbi:MAG TPA: hypothetical protein VK211_27440 [Kamptonema sp.]|nr:hypothetical protein [Kamptonema sp.]